MLLVDAVTCCACGAVLNYTYAEALRANGGPFVGAHHCHGCMLDRIGAINAGQPGKPIQYVRFDAGAQEITAS
jgi:hypothetical protein